MPNHDIDPTTHPLLTLSAASTAAVVAITLTAALLLTIAALTLILRAASKGPTGERAGNLVWLFVRTYARLVHRLRVEGAHHLDNLPTDRPIVLACNHTAGIDPLLVQAVFPSYIRWMMAADMQLKSAQRLWRWLRVIAVTRDGTPNPRSAIEAVRHLRAGGTDRPGKTAPNPGVVGIFPEGGIERPPQQLIPFMPGVGSLVSKANAVVVPAVIQGTPNAPTAWGSIWRPSRSTVTFLKPIDYAASETPPQDIAADLQQRFQNATNWPINTTPDRKLTLR